MTKKRGNAQFGGVFPPARRLGCVGGGDEIQRDELTERGMWLTVSRLQMQATRGVLCRAPRRREVGIRPAKQLGRERPPAAAPDPGSAVGAQGVAHAPAACLI